MSSVLDDPDIRAISRDNNWVIFGDDPAEAERLGLFVQCIQASSDPPSEMDLTAIASAAMAAYDQRIDALPMGWQKLLLIRAGYSGIDLDSFEILDWTYKRCQEHGWGADGFETPIGSLVSHMAGPWAQGQMGRDAARERAATPSPKKRWFGR